MSNRAFAVILSALLGAIGIVIAVSLLMGNLTLSPLSLALLALLVVVPAGLFLRLQPMALMDSMMPDEMREQIRERAKARRNRMSPGAWRICMASLVSAYAVIAAVGLLSPSSPDSFWFGAPMLVALGLFLFGYLGLIYTSIWVQRHAVVLAFAGIPVLTSGILLLVHVVRVMSWSFVVFPLALIISGGLLICLPIQVSFLRSRGQID